MKSQNFYLLFYWHDGISVLHMKLASVIAFAIDEVEWN